MRRAVFRALQRGVVLAWVQRSNHRGALFHRTDRASSQAIERGPGRLSIGAAAGGISRRDLEPTFQVRARRSTIASSCRHLDRAPVELG